jgi:hypothetical protein
MYYTSRDFRKIGIIAKMAGIIISKCDPVYLI